MNTIKKITYSILIMILIICFSNLSFLTVSAETYSGKLSDNFTWAYDKDTGTLTVFGSGEMKSDFISTKKLPWDKYREEIKNLKLQEGITSISSGMFSRCTQLKQISIPSTVESIGGDAFFQTGYFNDSANWENGVLYIGNYLIKANRNVLPSSYSVKEGTIAIAGGAFDNCNKLAEITLPQSLKSIGEDAFDGCSKLKTINNYSLLPIVARSHEYGGIAEWTDNKVNSFSNIVLSGTCGDDLNWKITESTDTLTISGSGKMTDYSYGEAPWDEYKSLIKNIKLPAELTNIGNHAFWGIDGLTEIEIPNKVTSIGEGAFKFCNSLTMVLIGDSVENIGIQAFQGCESLVEIAIPNSVINIEVCAFRDCIELTKATIGNGTINIDDSAFSGCSALTKVTLGKSVENISYHAFANCESLREILIPNSVTQIGAGAFSHCTSLYKATIGCRVSNIGGGAFYGCTNLEKVINYSNLNIFKGSNDFGYVAYYADTVENRDGFLNNKKNIITVVIILFVIILGLIFLKRKYKARK